VFGIVFITDFFDGYELQLVGVYAFILLMGILDIFTDDYHDSPRRRSGKPSPAAY
jgi:hypothetical protein